MTIPARLAKLERLIAKCDERLRDVEHVQIELLRRGDRMVRHVHRLLRTLRAGRARFDAFEQDVRDFMRRARAPKR